MLRWTGRRNKLPKQFGKSRTQYDATKVIFVGKITQESAGRGPMIYNCLMVFNLVKQEIEKLKVFAFMSPDLNINCIEYGPFDNGHILLGLSDGWLLAYEYPSLKRLDSKQVYKSDEPDVLSPLNLCEKQSEDSFIETQFDKVNDGPYSPVKMNNENLAIND